MTFKITRPYGGRTPEEWAAAIERNRQIALKSDIGPACQITHGRYFWPLTPDHPGNDYDIEFIAHVLAREPRWASVTVDAYGDPSNYSVAQHSCIVADLVNLNRRTLVPEVDWDNEPAPTFYGLMHDGSEAYLRDVPRPLKPELGDYYGIEARLMAQIISRFNVPVTDAIKRAVRKVDDMMIFLERDELVGQPVVPYAMEDQHPGITIHDVVPDFYVWSPKEAKDNFLAKFAEVAANDGNHIPLAYKNRGYLLAA